MTPLVVLVVASKTWMRLYKRKRWVFRKNALGAIYLFMHEKELVGFATLSTADLKREKMKAKHRPQSKIENCPALLIG